MPVKIPTGRVRVKTLEEGVDLIQQHCLWPDHLPHRDGRHQTSATGIPTWTYTTTGGNLILKFNSANPTARFSERIRRPIP
jgi:hypothetical protein